LTSLPIGLNGAGTLFAAYGLRRSEVVSLTLGDIDWQTGLRRGPQSKTRQHLILPLTEDPARPEAVFRNHWRTNLTRFGVRLIMRKYVQQAAREMPALKKKRLHPHCIRHSTALHLLRTGVDLSTIAHWLGHASLNTTNKYIALDLQTKREALAKAEPLAQEGKKAGAWKRDPNLIAWLQAL